MKYYRLVCAGVVIDQIEAHLGPEFSTRMLMCFRDNIQKALTDPSWRYNNTMSGKEWLAWQENRLGVKLSDNLTILGPDDGQSLRLCPYLVNRGKQRERVFID